MGAPILSHAEALEQKGLQVPSTDLGRISLYEFIFGPGISEVDQQKRVEEIKQLQERYIGKVVYKTMEPNVQGVVIFLRPTLSRSLPTKPRTDFRSSPFEAFVKWNSGKQGPVPLAMLGIAEDKSSPR